MLRKCKFRPKIVILWSKIEIMCTENARFALCNGALNRHPKILRSENVNYAVKKWKFCAQKWNFYAQKMENFPKAMESQLFHGFLPNRRAKNSHCHASQNSALNFTVFRHACTCTGICLTRQCKERATLCKYKVKCSVLLWYYLLEQQVCGTY